MHGDEQKWVDDAITFNTACINGVEDAVYIQVMINRDQHRMVIRKCEENDKDSLRWCISKPDKRKSRKISSKEFSRRIYELMDWNDKCRYKVLGHRIEFEGNILYVFELDEPEIVFERKKKTVAQVTESKEEGLTQEQITERQNEEEGMPVKPFYPDDWDELRAHCLQRQGNWTQCSSSTRPLSCPCSCLCGGVYP